MSEETKVVGINIRREATSSSDKLGILPRGARVEVGERSPNGKWARIAKLLEGAIAPAVKDGAVDPGAGTGWIFLAELDAEPGDPKAFDSIVVLEKPAPIAAGTLIGYIGEYQQYYDAQPTAKRGWRPLLHLEVFGGEDVPTFIADSRRYAATLPEGGGSLFVVDVGAKMVYPSKPQLTLGAGEHVVEAPGSSKEGRWAQVTRVRLELREREALGAFNAQTQAYAKGGVWTGWFVGAQDTDRTRNEAEAKKKKYTRREVKVPFGEPLWVERAKWRDGAQQEQLAQPLPAWSAFPLQTKNASEPAVGLARVLSKEELESVPGVDRATAPDGTRWWRLNARTADLQATHNMIWAGWVCEKGMDKVSWQSPWAWPGFEVVEEGGIEPMDMMSTVLHRLGQAKPGEGVDFKARADKVDKSKLVRKLYEIIDRNNNGVFDATEVRKANELPLLAEALSRLIAGYETEWGGDMAKWNALDPLMLDGKTEWQAEKIRIDKLRWWPQVAAKVKGFPAKPLAFHFHPVGLVANFLNVARSGGMDELIRRIGDIIAHGEGGYEAYNSGTKGVKRGKVGHSFPNPPAGTVTSKTINQILATDPLSGTDKDRMFATGKYQTTLETLRLAKTAMKLSGNERYDAAMQERVFREYLIYKAGGGALARFVFDGKGTLEDAQYAAAQEWASIAAPNGRAITSTVKKNADGTKTIVKRTSDGTLSYYESAANHANKTSTSNLRAILKEISQTR
ncbi:SH3 domain-containing protein [Lysobacter enzymogenes]|uniref:SH3 domain-containing protein n=1 Tax=Lysobacter enzymogenes TaxID=69 RepID=UPI001AF0D7AF|nr:SH3 domain-containing protein [Lysobacter enzymogenes]QQQ00761.1 SH3 domain-containing protein [Lysobacter enzymogenes]